MVLFSELESNEKGTKKKTSEYDQEIPQSHTAD